MGSIAAAVAAIGTPALWWKLADTSGTACADASGSAHPGVRSGSTIATGLAGPLFSVADTAMSFTGTNPVAQVAYGAWAEATVYGITVFFKTGTLAASNVLVARDHQSGGRRFQVTIDSAGRLGFSLFLSTNVFSTITTTATYNDGLWHMATVTFDTAAASSVKQRIYVDNSSADVAHGGSASSINSASTAVPFSVGNATRTTQVPSNCTESQVIYWTGVAPTGAQHQAIWVAANTPDVPTSVAASGATATTLDLTWAAPAGGGLAPTSYDVRINGGAASTATSPHTFTGLTPGTSYTLEVRAVGPGGTSGWVSAVESTLDPPGIPTAVTVGAIGYTHVGLSWSPPASGGTVSSYDVRVDGGSASTAASPHDFTGLDDATSYTLEVRAVGPGGTSAWVAVMATTLEAPPGYYRVTLTLGSHDWSVEYRDAPPDASTTADFGPQLPIRQGWVIPDQVASFPAMPDPTTLSFRVLVQDAQVLSDVDEGSTVSFRLYVEPDPDADPWQHFDGIVTQLDGAVADVGQGTLAWQVTVYAAEDNMRLDRIPVGYTSAWPQESQLDRLATIAAEAGISIGTMIDTGLEGTLPARPAGKAISVLQAIRDTLQDAANIFTDVDGDWFGRYVFMYDPTVPGVVVTVFHRRVHDGWTVTLDGCVVEAAGSWSKLPAAAGGRPSGSWVLLTPSGTVFGTPDANPPILYNAGTLVYPDVGTSAELDRIGDSLLPDGSTQLTGWYARALRYRAARDTDSLDPTTGWASANTSIPGGGTNLIRCQPVVVAPLDPDYELQGVDYLAGTLTGCALVIPAGGDFYLELRLRPELLPGTELP